MAQRQVSLVVLGSGRYGRVGIVTRTITAGQLFADRYRLDGQVGRGGMATVWRGFDLRLHRAVAVKTLDPAMFAELGMRRRFQREAQTVAGLTHPNVVAVHDAAVEDDVAYVVMELVDGPSVAGLLAQRGRLPVAQAVDIALQICEALGAAHDAGVVHRDVTPANVLLTSTGVVKVCDFGIAALQHSAYPSLAAGTRGFMAPEQADGRPVDSRADLYGLGCVLYAMLTGTAPDRGAVDVGRSGVGVPPSVANVMRRLMADDPQARPQTAAQASDLLAATGLVAPSVEHGGRGRHSAPDQTTVGVAAVPTRLFEPTPVAPTELASAGSGRDRWLAPVLWSGGAVALIALLALAFAVLPRGGSDPVIGAQVVTPTASPAASPTPTASPVADDPAALLAALDAEVDAQLASGGLDRGRAVDLHKRIDEVRESIADDEGSKAGEKVRELSNKLTELRRDDKLSEAGYAALATLIERIRAAVGGGED
jgi:eukaryotic-like serine/threonine-protein kinase